MFIYQQNLERISIRLLNPCKQYTMEKILTYVSLCRHSTYLEYCQERLGEVIKGASFRLCFIKVKLAPEQLHSQ